jgi:hypothetical protein
MFLFPGGPISQDDIKIPKDLREAFSKTVSPTVNALEEAGLLSLLNQAVVSLQQIPKLVNEVGGREVSRFFFFFFYNRREKGGHQNSHMSSIDLSVISR